RLPSSSGRKRTPSGPRANPSRRCHSLERFRRRLAHPLLHQQASRNTATVGVAHLHFLSGPDLQGRAAGILRTMRLPLAFSAIALLGIVPALQAQVPAPALHQAGATQSVPLDRVVAVVGDVVVTQSSLQERVIAKRNEGATLPTDSAAFRTFLLGVIDELVQEELLIQKAKELSVTVPDADVASTVDKQYKDVRKRFSSEAEFKSELNKAGYGSPEEYKRFLTDGIKRSQTITRVVKKLREDGKVTQANVTDAEVADAYERSKGNLPKREPSVTWRQIIVAPHASAPAKALAKAKADSLLLEIKAGADFEKVAKRESQDPGSKESGGDLGWNRRGKMVIEFDRWMFSIPPGELSPVIETPFGYHIIRVDQKTPAEVKARHILIAPRIDSLDVARGKLEADSVESQWRAGVSFDSLAKKHHDFKSGEETTLLTPFPRAQLPPQYQAAFADKKAKDVVEFQIPGSGNVPVKFVVAEIASVEQGGDLSLAEVKEQFRSRLAEEGGIKRLMDSLRKGTYVVVHKDALDLTPPPAARPAGS
ncbi:MAG: SurA protein, partial [Gemmatimonadetes bacterium]|nr:SurA protein [Gemmatimonadota bacterium]